MHDTYILSLVSGNSQNTGLSNMIDYKRKGTIKEIKHTKTEENKGD